MEDQSNIPVFVDVDKLIASKNPALLKWIPRFVRNYIKRVVHQDEINYIIHTYGPRQGIGFVNGIIYEHFQISYATHGLEAIPAVGRYVFASNHPLGAFDGLVLMSAIGARFEHIRFIVNDLLLNIKSFDPLFVPVNKHGRQSTTYAGKIEEVYAAEDTQVLNFPAGLCSRRIKGEITDLPWKRNFLHKAIHYRRDIVPVYFDGRNSNFFYRLANFRKFLGIKANIEMFYLPNELFKQKKAHYNVYFGEPIPYQTFDKSRTVEEWTKVIREKAYALKPR
ncbi:MAG: 1-acyl-sn-glycerol-3-phosphate acyltransferase [Bacteroidales bacterium]|nr:1-acyl-sn-glycerol-3-phosphate acyltransferase [Bacteroidales bacterium]MCL2132831.1 1-acyl-sn-glycerol-3-phosphate acyltransferase [Bacteroidales bacterium]